VDKLLEQGYEVTGIDCFTDYYPGETKEAIKTFPKDFLLAQTFSLKEKLYQKNGFIPKIEKAI